MHFQRCSSKFSHQNWQGHVSTGTGSDNSVGWSMTPLRLLGFTKHPAIWDGLSTQFVENHICNGKWGHVCFHQGGGFHSGFLLWSWLWDPSGIVVGSPDPQVYKWLPRLIFSKSTIHRGYYWPILAKNGCSMTNQQWFCCFPPFLVPWVWLKNP